MRPPQLLDDPSVAQDDDALGEPGQLAVVGRDDDDSRPVGSRLLDQDVDDTVKQAAGAEPADGSQNQ